MFFRCALAASAAALLSSGAIAATLSTGVGDGSVVIDVGDFGASSSALYDPLGELDAADTFFDSDVYMPSAVGRSTVGSMATDLSIISQTGTQYVTSFNIGALSVLLTQTLTDSVDEGSVTGSVLTQAFRITNTGVQTSFDIVRYLDADLAFDNSRQDSGGIVQAGGTRVLFEIEADNVPGSETTFVGINASTSGNNTSPNALSQNYEFNEYSQLETDIQSGATLRNLIEGDSDGDGFIDGTYDVTMALQNFVTIPTNGTVTYTTSTLFGNAVPPTPGSTEALPLLPETIGPDGGFEFEVLAEDIVPGQVIWIDPVIATGYTYEVTGAEFTSVQLPSFASVPDSDYTLVVNGMSYSATSGELIEFSSLTSETVSMFQILGIDVSLLLDPTDTAAFVTGIVLDFLADAATVTQTPITFDTDGTSPVPLPAGLVLLGTSLGAFGIVSRRRRRAAA